MIDIILPFLPPHDLFIVMTTKKNCQKFSSHELVVKAVINYFRKLMTEHTNYVTTINSLNTISYICAIIWSTQVPSQVRLLLLVHGQTCEFCLIHPLDKLDNFFGMFACQTCLGYESGTDLIQVCNLKKAIIQSKKNSVFNLWSHQYHILMSNRWCALLLEIQLWRLYRWNDWTFIYLDRLEWNCKLDQCKRNQT